ncbi:sigma-70 family RNA polymerase sigma factor [Falsarthrobacter nasiphocae]|uniref:RNA polymerase sigma factor (Sigma-70 family) n=1 Tax=Falsarthrobacter nasiphocae TaxID=189863 RepID=A0AAE3YIN4_9MICC|nr:sigma-70 family RNA polymerase sigma factor [Falsarthrobacter nasiphocae]MDR6892456.1 RNA polymerase sigma factor (sigma-70 family) [Falsarthrobacter nasiphocae]
MPTAETAASLAERSDAELIAASRSGDQGSFEELYRRHADAVRSVARRHVNNQSDVEDLTSEAFAKVLELLQRGIGPHSFFRAYVCTTVSRLAFAANQQGDRSRPTDEPELFDDPDEGASDPIMKKFESGVVARAFLSLPERWQSVLWYQIVDGMTPAEIAPLLGLRPNGVSALLVRAKEGLRNAYLQEHVQQAGEDECAPHAAMLGAYVRNGLSARNRSRVEAHVTTCSRCAALILQLEDVSVGMRGIVLPLHIGLIGGGGTLLAAAAGSGAAGGLAGSPSGAADAVPSHAGAAVEAAGPGLGAAGAAGAAGALASAAPAAAAVPKPWWAGMTQGAGLAASSAGVVAVAATVVAVTGAPLPWDKAPSAETPPASSQSGERAAGLSAASSTAGAQGASQAAPKSEQKSSPKAAGQAPAGASAASAAADPAQQPSGPSGAPAGAGSAEAAGLAVVPAAPAGAPRVADPRGPAPAEAVQPDTTAQAPAPTDSLVEDQAPFSQPAPDGEAEVPTEAPEPVASAVAPAEADPSRPDATTPRTEPLDRVPSSSAIPRPTPSSEPKAPQESDEPTQTPAPRPSEPSTPAEEPKPAEPTQTPTPRPSEPSRPADEPHPSTPTAPVHSVDSVPSLVPTDSTINVTVRPDASRPVRSLPDPLVEEHDVSDAWSPYDEVIPAPLPSRDVLDARETTPTSSMSLLEYLFVLSDRLGRR